MYKTIQKKHITALLAAMAGLGSAVAYGQAYTDIAINPPTWAIANSSDTYAQTKASPVLSAAATGPSSAEATALQTAFNDAVAGLNGDASVLGSAANYQAARAALDAAPSNVTLQEELARSVAQYGSYNTTITNLSSAATVAEGTTIASYNGISGADLGSATLATSAGAIQAALDAAALSSAAISDAVDYYSQGAGASTSATSYADLEGGVITKLQAVGAGTVGAGALEYTADGFRNQELDAYNLAAADLATAQAAYATAIGDPLATSGDIAAAGGALAAAEQAYAASITDLYATFAPITDTAKDNLMGAVLNGSWERDAIKSNTEAIVAGADATAANTAAIATNTADIATNTAAIATNTADIATNTTAIAANTADIATNAAGIAANTAAINQEVADRTALIRQETDGSIHIGANSLVTNHTGADGLGNGGVQELYAQDASGNAIDINVTNGSNLQVNGVNVATVADVAAEEAARIAADNALGLRIDGETTARIAADDALGLRIDNEAAIRASEDTLIRADIAAEAATRLAADTQLQANIDTETAARIAADNIHDTRLNGLEAEFAQGGRVTNLENRVGTLEGRTAALEGRVGRVERDVRSLRKGIAMAAALQTPIIEPGKNNAVKFGASVYDGEQGLGLGYARRINDSVQVNVDVATGFPETVARGGVNFSF